MKPEGDTLHCPVTVGRATRMTAESFARLCKHRREQKAGFWIGLYYREVGTGDLKFKVQRRCEWCKGERSNWPPELEIIEISNMTAQIRHPGSGRGHAPDSFSRVHCPATSKPSARRGAQLKGASDVKPGNCGPSPHDNQGKKEDMAMMKKCDICGNATRKENTSHGMTLCCSCRGIIPGLTKHPDKLLKIAQRLGKVEDVVELFGGVTQAASAEEARHNLEAVVQDARATLIKALPPAPESLDDTQSLFDIAEIAEETARHIDALTEALGMRQRENAELRQRLEQSGNAEAELNRMRELLAEKDKQANEYCEKLNRLERGVSAAMEGTVCGSGNDPLEAALLRWAISQHQAGKVKVQVEVVEVEP